MLIVVACDINHQVLCALGKLFSECSCQGEKKTLQKASFALVQVQQCKQPNKKTIEARYIMNVCSKL